jgi:TolB protein
MTAKRLLPLLAGLVLAAPQASAQNVDPSQMITLRLQYDPNSEPRVLILPMNFPAGDSIRAIMQRDFSNGNRIDVIRGADSLTLPVRGDSIDYTIFQQIGAVALVHVIPTATGINVTLHDVAARRNAGARDFNLPGAANSAEWRWALHGVSDEVHMWITREPGIAQTRIAFSRAGDLFVIDSDGENERRVESGGLLAPAWHPTEAVLAFSALRDLAWQIGLKPLNGGPVRWLTNSRDGVNFSPAFSPDGNEIYFQRSDNQHGGIWTVPYSGPPARSLLSDQNNNVAPAVSPDGSRLMFVSNRLGNNPILFLMNKDGSDPRVFIFPRAGERWWMESPSWSPDGNKVAYQVRRGQDALYQIEVADIRSRGTGTGVLQTDDGENQAPSWAPDSRHIVFESNRSGEHQLYIRDTMSGRTRVLTRGPSGAKNAAWSPRYK